MEKTEGEDTLERDPEDLEVSEKQTPAESSAGPSTVVPPVYLLQTRAPIAASELPHVPPDEDWRQWGPYLSERHWATVRERDQNRPCCSLESFSYTDATTNAYRWGEDGLLGFMDSEAHLCLSLALWNGQDPFLKERLYGLTGAQGNHGEDVKELYYYLDGTPTHTYMRALYKYPQTAFPYDLIERGNEKRGLGDREYELLDTGLRRRHGETKRDPALVLLPYDTAMNMILANCDRALKQTCIFNNDRYWDVYVEYAKHSPQDILIRYTITNRGSEAATLHVLPTIWFRNTWSWQDASSPTQKPELVAEGNNIIKCSHPLLEEYTFVVDSPCEDQKPTLLFTNNESQSQAMSQSHRGVYTKDGINQYVVHGGQGSVNPELCGTKASALYRLVVKAGDTAVVRCRLFATGPQSPSPPWFGQPFDDLISERISDTDTFYSRLLPTKLRSREVEVSRQAYAGLCWNKQFYSYDGRHHSKPHSYNPEWTHNVNCDIISIPDKWEFPWYASWDIAFQMVPYSRIDPNFAKHQIMLLLSEKYMNYNGQIPGCEFNFSDDNPPVIAWAVLKIHRIAGTPDFAFLRRTFHKLLLNFTWCMSGNKKSKRYGFLSGFLGMDNISCVDRSNPPRGVSITQADGACWMAFYCISMLDLSLELARHDAVYEDIAIQMLNNFLVLCGCINGTETADSGRSGCVWDDRDQFYYDSVETNGVTSVLRIRSLVGLTSLFSSFVIDTDTLSKLPRFTRALRDSHRNDQTGSIIFNETNDTYLLTVPSECHLKTILSYMLDENEFLAAFGIRSLSKFHETRPFSVVLSRQSYTVQFSAGESNSGMFGGNSNWRGPVWFCMNLLVIESLESYDKFFEDRLLVDFPTVRGRPMRLRDVSIQLCTRLVDLFLPDEHGHRPCHGGEKRYSADPAWKDLVLFHEYFDGDTGRGCGASHQTGWTALVSYLMDKIAACR